MTSFDIKPNTFFKAIGLEKEITFHLTKIEDDFKIITLWKNNSQNWKISLYTTFEETNITGLTEVDNQSNKQSWEKIEIEPGVIFQITFPSKEVQQIKDSNNNSVFKGPATLNVQTKIPADKLKKTNSQVLKEYMGTEDCANAHMDIRPTSNNKEIYPLPAQTLEKNRKSISTGGQAQAHNQSKSNIVVFEQKLQNKAIQNTKNILFLRKLKDFLYKEEYKVFLSLRGIGYRVFISDDNKSLNFKLGYTHPINVDIPEGISAVSSTDRSATVGGGDNQFLTLSGLNYQKLTQFANLLVTLRPPEPYKGKGILIRTKKHDLQRQNRAKK